MAKSKKVNKWDAAPESIRKLKEAINGTADGMCIVGGLNTANDWEQHLMDILGKVLDDYNELEAKHNADCGLISKLEEEVTDYKDTVKEFENKRAADLQCDLDAAIYDLKKEEENVECLKKQITRKNAEMCILKLERDETEKKIKILIDKLQEQYDINVTFYQNGNGNFGVHVDCEENRKAFLELGEGYEKLKKEVEDLKSENRSWQVSYNAVEIKVTELTAERDGLNDYVEALKGRIQELEDRSKDIYTLATIGWLTSSMREYDLIRKILTIDPKE